MSDYELRPNADPVKTGGASAGFWLLVVGGALVLLFALLLLGGGGGTDIVGPEAAGDAPAMLQDTAPSPAAPPVAAPDMQ